MSTTAHANMHSDHNTWQREDDLWRDEVSIWQKETKRALAELPLLERALTTHLETLEKHAASVRLYEQEFLKHEHNVAAYERRSIPYRLLHRTQVHADEAEQHGAQRAMQYQTMQKHHDFMAKWNRLFAAIAPHMESTG
jgi:hypothetical protein